MSGSTSEQRAGSITSSALPTGPICPAEGAGSSQAGANSSSSEAGRLLREAAILSSLQHPNIVTYHESFVEGEPTDEEARTEIAAACTRPRCAQCHDEAAGLPRSGGTAPEAACPGRRAGLLHVEVGRPARASLSPAFCAPTQAGACTW